MMLAVPEQDKAQLWWLGMIGRERERDRETIIEKADHKRERPGGRKSERPLAMTRTGKSI